MATIKSGRATPVIEYPDADGKPMAETPEHRDNLAWLIEMLRAWFEGNDRVYISGNTFLYYVQGNPRRHVSPDVFVVRDVPRLPERRRYLLWEERKGPDLVIELTSQSTQAEDVRKKFLLYRDTLHVKEYFLFDPNEEYLDPPLQGYRLRGGRYVRINPVAGRLLSRVVGLHLERDGWLLRLYDANTQRWLPTPPEVRAALEQEAAGRQQAEAEVERLRRELEALRRAPKQP
jgi:Uma2 family endonuclease